MHLFQYLSERTSAVVSGIMFARNPSTYKPTSTDEGQGRNTWTCMQLAPIDLAEVLIDLEEEWKGVREHSMLFQVLEMLVKNAILYKNLSFGNTQRIQYSVISGYTNISSKTENHFEL